MGSKHPIRYEMVSRRAMLKASIGTGTAMLLPGLACANNDSQTLTNAVAEPKESTTSTTADSTELEPTGEVSDVLTEPAVETVDLGEDGAAVIGELVVSFTYTQGSGGRNKFPYIAVWIEDSEGDLVDTVALWYEQGRRGERWLDHLADWFAGDEARVLSGGTDDAATISSATRAPGEYSVVWGGLAEGSSVAAGDYHLCIESAREEGDHSLVRQALTLSGSLAETVLPDDGELSNGLVRIDV